MTELFSCRLCRLMAPPASGYSPARLEYGSVMCQPCATIQTLARSMFDWIEREEFKAWANRATQEEIRTRFLPTVASFYQTQIICEAEAQGRDITEAEERFQRVFKRVEGGEYRTPQARERAGQHADQAMERISKQGQDESKKQQREQQKRRKQLLQTSGVYVIQLLKRSNIFKIGQSTCCADRLSGLRAQYGLIHAILIIPDTQPARLEKTLHERFAAMRIYDGSSSSELFCFDTVRKRKGFEQFLGEFPTYRLDAIQWQGTNETSRMPSTLPSDTLPLFS